MKHLRFLQHPLPRYKENSSRLQKKEGSLKVLYQAMPDHLLPVLRAHSGLSQAHQDQQSQYEYYSHDDTPFPIVS